MKLPDKYDDDFLGLEGGNYPDGTPIKPRVYSLVFPPIGFFPFYSLGNGDDHGFYWPIGRESGPPIVAFSSHDVGSLIPERTDIEQFYRCELARTEDKGSAEDDNSLIDSYRELTGKALGRQPVEHDIRGLAANDFEELLAIDPTSPFCLCATGDVDVANNKIESAESRYRQAIQQLPEYVAAHFGLACVLRRQRRADEATIHLRKTLIGPLAFYGGSFWADTSLPGSFRNDWRRKSLMWLQGSKTCHESLIDDPFVAAAGKLTFKSGLAENPDIDILRSLVDEYATAGAFAESALIWQLIGDCASSETTSFRERYQLNPRTYGMRLVELLELSGNSLRATLVRNMLATMDKPEGLHL